MPSRRARTRSRAASARTRAATRRASASRRIEAKRTDRALSGTGWALKRRCAAHGGAREAREAAGNSRLPRVLPLASAIVRTTEPSHLSTPPSPIPHTPRMRSPKPRTRTDLEAVGVLCLAAPRLALLRGPPVPVVEAERRLQRREGRGASAVPRLAPGRLGGQDGLVAGLQRGGRHWLGAEPAGSQGGGDSVICANRVCGNRPRTPTPAHSPKRQPQRRLAVCRGNRGATARTVCAAPPRPRPT